MIPSKSDLRVEMRRRRRELAAARPEAPEQAAALLPIERLGAAGVVSGYQPIGAEFDPWPALRRLAGAGWRVVLPVALDRSSPLVFRAYREGDALEPDAVRIPAPLASAEALVPDVVLTPLVAFDGRGYRLGQGAGHYDRTLQALRAVRPVLVVGLAYAGQEVDEVPREPHDQPLDAILTETGYRPRVD